MIAHKEGNSYILDYYEDHDGTGSFALQSQNPISSFNTSDVRSLSVKDIIPVKSNSSGYCIYAVSYTHLICIDGDIGEILKKLK